MLSLLILHISHISISLLTRFLKQKKYGTAKDIFRYMLLSINYSTENFELKILLKLTEESCFSLMLLYMLKNKRTQKPHYSVAGMMIS